MINFVRKLLGRYEPKVLQRSDVGQPTKPVNPDQFWDNVKPAKTPQTKKATTKKPAAKKLPAKRKAAGKTTARTAAVRKPRAKAPKGLSLDNIKVKYE